MTVSLTVVTVIVVAILVATGCRNGKCEKGFKFGIGMPAPRHSAASPCKASFLYINRRLLPFRRIFRHPRPSRRRSQPFSRCFFRLLRSPPDRRSTRLSVPYVCLPLTLSSLSRSGIRAFAQGAGRAADPYPHLSPSLFRPHRLPENGLPICLFFMAELCVVVLQATRTSTRIRTGMSFACPDMPCLLHRRLASCL